MTKYPTFRQFMEQRDARTAYLFDTSVSPLDCDLFMYAEVFQDVDKHILFKMLEHIGESNMLAAHPSIFTVPQVVTESRRGLTILRNKLQYFEQATTNIRNNRYRVGDSARFKRIKDASQNGDIQRDLLKKIREEYTEYIELLRRQQITPWRELGDFFIEAAQSMRTKKPMPVDEETLECKVDRHTDELLLAAAVQMVLTSSRRVYVVTKDSDIHRTYKNVYPFLLRVGGNFGRKLSHFPLGVVVLNPQMGIRQVNGVCSYQPDFNHPHYETLGETIQPVVHAFQRYLSRLPNGSESWATRRAREKREAEMSRQKGN